jgi:hypothetical protein
VRWTVEELTTLFIEEGRCEGGWSPCSWLAAANGLPSGGPA